MGVVMMGIMPSFVIRCAADWRLEGPRPRSRYVEGNSLLGDGLIDSSSSIPVLERRASSICMLWM